MDANTHTLNISIQRAEGIHQIELSHSDPNSQAEVAPVRGTAAFDPTALLELEALHTDYGKALAKQLFADDEVLLRFVQVEAMVQALGGVLRVLLRIEPSASELQRLRWELLCHPHSGEPLSTSETVLLCRSMLSNDTRPVKLRPRTELTALIAISAPEADKLQKMGLAPVDYEGEVGRVRKALAGVSVRTLGGPGSPFTLDRLIEELRSGVDILYLVSHGMFGRSNGIAALILQDEAGEAKPVTGEDLGIRIDELQVGPRLVVLASCQSAGDGMSTTAEPRTTAQVTLVGHLADAGVPAVIAMQGSITMATVEAMMPTFFTELLRDGQIDRALAVARGKVRDRDDAWMPALFTRLTTGCLWTTPPPIPELRPIAVAEPKPKPLPLPKSTLARLALAGVGVLGLGVFGLSKLVDTGEDEDAPVQQQATAGAQKPEQSKPQEQSKPEEPKPQIEQPQSAEKLTEPQPLPGQSLGIVRTALLGEAPMNLVALTGGEFTMGSPETERHRAADETLHHVRLSPFEICRTEVSLAQYELVMHARPNDCFRGGCEDQQPVQMVSWYDAVRFMNALTRRENEHTEGAKMTECYDETTWTWRRECTGYRLPTEAEWEYAARAGTTTPWSFGSDEQEICEYANVDSQTCGDGHTQLAPVVPTGLRANAWGLHAMHGNAWEWVFDVFAPYDTQMAEDPFIVSGGNADALKDQRILRGGGLLDFPQNARSAIRGSFSPDSKDGTIGFRCARGALPKK
jgi:formylglycine-generating enzyme required for sulfatase activity